MSIQSELLAMRHICVLDAEDKSANVSSRELVWAMYA